jgi:hypothetical protein
MLGLSRTADVPSQSVTKSSSPSFTTTARSRQRLGGLEHTLFIVFSSTVISSYIDWWSEATPSTTGWG